MKFFYNIAVEQLIAVYKRPYYQTVGWTVSKKTLDRPEGPVIAASGKRGCTL